MNYSFGTDSAFGGQDMNPDHEDKDDTTIVEGAGNKSVIEGRVRQLRTQIEETTSDYDREKLQERLAKIVGGVAVNQYGRCD